MTPLLKCNYLVLHDLVCVNTPLNQTRYACKYVWQIHGTHNILRSLLRVVHEQRQVLEYVLSKDVACYLLYLFLALSLFIQKPGIFLV